VAGAALVRAELGTGTPPGQHPPEPDATQASTAAKATDAAAAAPSPAPDRPSRARGSHAGRLREQAGLG